MKIRWRAWLIGWIWNKRIQSMLTRRHLIRKLRWRRTRIAGWTPWLVAPSSFKRRKWSRGTSSMHSKSRNSMRSSSWDKRTSTGSSTRQSSPMKSGCSITRRHHQSWSSSTVISFFSQSKRSRLPLSSELPKKRARSRSSGRSSTKKKLPSGRNVRRNSSATIASSSLRRRKSLRSSSCTSCRCKTAGLSKSKQRHWRENWTFGWLRNVNKSSRPSERSTG